ncbi:hypothetical protein SAMN05428989_3568 [Pseudoxanthomonas sp. GM95]|uniref:hypothetical protein n=1 Tax=Pseudoxanthomonas sp. GM95 TaxID=1881043 RepID=UPI0008B3B7E3|nr:hypothetical protein [Pseudoxanthomonas sp. GM95]SEM26864.1 hypothetical protein SAMN05428989_3568 [Pseudoxanthomonas sp. GM95]
MILRLLLALTFVLACFAAEGQARRPLDVDAIMRAKAATDNALFLTARGADLQSGISKYEADAIAKLYFATYIVGCGTAYGAADEGAVWKVTPLIGVAAVPDKSPIIINKHSGAISWGDGPAFASLAKFLSEISRIRSELHKGVER